MNYEELVKALKTKPNDRELIRKELEYWVRAKSKSRLIPIRLLDRIPYKKRKKKKMEVNDIEVIARIR